MLALHIALLLLLLAICCFFPGFVIVRKLRWSPMEKVCGSIGASLVILYLASFLIFVLWLPWWSCWVVTAASLIAAAVFRRELRALFRVRRVRLLFAAFGFLLLWTLTLLLFVQTYSGGGWGGDWLEHFHRSLFFLLHLPMETTFVDLYALPARPPMMNLLGAFFLAQAGDSFENFSVVFVLLNLLVFFACALMLAALARRGSKRIPILAALFACSPMAMQNATYTWTKSLCSFFVIFGLWLYLAGRRKRDATRTAAAFLALAAGMLVHYSAAPYLLFLAAHLLVTSVRRWRIVVVAGACASLLFGTWLAWSIAHYGLRMTFASNTTVTTSRQLGDSNVRKVVLNLRDTIVPHPLRDFSIDRDQRQAGYIRDSFFLMDQTNLITGMGISGGFVVVYLAIRLLRRRRETFWLIFVPSIVIIGIAVVGERDAAGSAHLTLQPLMFLGLTLLAARFFTLGTLGRSIVIAGCAADLVFGVFLQHSLEHYENQPCAERFHSEVRSSGTGLYVATRSDLSPAAAANWELKRYGFVPKTIAATLSSARFDPRMHDAVMHSLDMQSRLLREQDKRWWGGWWGRHNDRITYLGDHIGCQVWFLYVFDAMLMAGWLGLIRRRSVLEARARRKTRRRKR